MPSQPSEISPLVFSTVTHDLPLLTCLDRIANDAISTPVSQLPDGCKRHFHSRPSRKDVERRLSTDALMDIRSIGDRHRADVDQFKLKLDISEQDRLELVSKAEKAFSSQGLIAKDDRLVLSGNGHYPPNSFMGWHTNSDQPSRRIYCNYAFAQAESGLYFCYPNISPQRRVLWDDHGWSIRVFDTGGYDKFWHAVACFSTTRISIGFRVLRKDELRKR